MAVGKKEIVFMSEVISLLSQTFWPEKKTLLKINFRSQKVDFVNII